MQNWKKQLVKLSLLAAVVISCCVTALAAPTSGSCGKNLSWKLDGDLLTISGSGNMVEFFQKDGAPWRHLKDRTERIVIGDGVTSVSFEAFQGFDKVRYVHVGDGVREVRTGAFNELPALKEVKLDNGVRKVGAMAFYGCPSLRKVQLGSSVEQIGRLAFAGCSVLEEIVLPEGLRHIDSSAFAGCSALMNLELPRGLCGMGANAMRNTGWYDQQDDGPLYLDHVLLGWKGEVPSSLSVRDGTRMIGDGAFLMEDALVEVTLPDSLRRIGESAFASCAHLTSVDFGEGVSHIGKYAFDHCIHLKGLSLPDSVSHAAAGAFSNAGLEGIRLSGNLEAISSKAFSRCGDLQAISIPGSVDVVDNEAFFKCSALTDVTFRGGAPYIERDAFYDVEARVYYPTGWSSDVRRDYCGDLHWVPVSSEMAGPELTLSIDPRDGKPRLRWSAVPGAEGYQVYRRVGREGSFVRLTTAKGTALRNGSAVPGTAYFYQVRAVDGGTVGTFSKIKNLTCDCAMPVVSVSLREDGKPVLRWDAVDGAVGYEVRRSVDGGEMVHLARVDGTALSNGSADPGTNYTYQVRALCENSYGNGAWSEAVSIYCPDVPKSPAVELDFDEETGLPRLSWAALQDAQRYEIWRSSGEEDFTLLGTTEENSFCDAAAVVGQRYQYQVRGVSDYFTGPFSEALDLQFGLEAPVLSVTLRQDGKPRLQWNAVGGAERYEILYSTSGEEGSFEHLFSTGGTRLSHGSAEPGVTYYYKVYGFAGDMIGPESEVVEALCPALTAPEVSTSARPETGKPQLVWTEVPGAERYEIWRSVEDGPFKLLHTTRGLKLNNSSAEAGVKYAYQVRAVTEDQQGPFSARKVRTCDCAAPVVSVELREDGKPYLQWNRVDGAERYEVWVSENGGKFRLLYTAQGLRLRHGSAKSGHDYEYKVSALCGNPYGNSAYGVPVSISVK